MGAALPDVFSAREAIVDGCRNQGRRADLGPALFVPGHIVRRTGQQVVHLQGVGVEELVEAGKVARVSRMRADLLAAQGVLPVVQRQLHALGQVDHQVHRTADLFPLHSRLIAADGQVGTGIFQGLAALDQGVDGDGVVQQHKGIVPAADQVGDAPDEPVGCLWRDPDRQLRIGGIQLFVGLHGQVGELVGDF